ncbi:hypothetical protein [Algoriphagus sp. Y33]|uniref:hypothetical protein n=1 Tax=Algoriphagus sp. Y33 TaxID=2772483 RepID=UPI00177E81DB|nr:hypothetical protein [Algoriphagus sp. Y33]
MATQRATALVVEHTDNMGDFNRNMDLSLKGAESVTAVVVNGYRVNAKQMTPVRVVI